MKQKTKGKINFIYINRDKLPAHARDKRTNASVTYYMRRQLTIYSYILTYITTTFTGREKEKVQR